MPARHTISSFWMLAALLAASLLLGGCGTKNIGLSKGSGRDIHPDTAQKATQSAISQSGVRYKWGGETPSGFDCSGLIWWAYRKHGVTVPRVTTGQARFGRGVSLAQARPGDILVFRINSGLHTALYAGKNQFVHSPSAGKRVRKDSVATTYWKTRLKDVRRVTL